MILSDEVITSRQNPTVKATAALADKKGRDAARAFLAEGEKLTFEAARAGLPILSVFVAESRLAELLPKIKSEFSRKEYDNVRLTVLSDSAFSKISTENAPQGLSCVIKYLDFFGKTDIIYKEGFLLQPTERALILCSVRDPGNLGSVIRSAVAFGVEHIILTDDCADIYHPRTVRSAMGGLFRVRVSITPSLGTLICDLHRMGRRVFAAELTPDAVPVGSAGLSPYDICMIGNEGHGIPPEISALCDRSVYIPISEKTESLNAAVAAAVLMWEQARGV